MEENNTNIKGNIGFYLGGFLVLVLLVVLGMLVGRSTASGGDSLEASSTVSESQGAEATPTQSPSEEPKVEVTEAPSAEPTVAETTQLPGTADALLEDIPTAVEHNPNDLMPGKFAEGNIYLGSQAPLGVTTPDVANNMVDSVSNLATAWVGGSSGWTWNASKKRYEPILDLACYQLERGYYGCNHDGGFQFIFSRKNGWLIGAVANKPSAAEVPGFKDDRMSKIHIRTTIDMEKGSYPAQLDKHFLPTYANYEAYGFHQ